MYIVGIDAGHGGSDSGAVGMGYYEKNIALDIALKLREKLQNHGFQVVMSRDADYRLSEDLGADLSSRANIFNEAGCDAVLSIHLNSSCQPAWGTETYTWDGNYYGNDFGDAIHNAVIASGMYSVNRGRKYANFAIVRETDAVAALVETAFINSDDVYNVAGKEDAWADCLCNGICSYFGVTKKAPEKKQVQQDILYDMPILANQFLDADTMAEYALSKNANPKINCTMKELAQYFLEEGEAEGVRGDIAFAQSLHETGNFNYGNLVLPEQNNFAGLGATNNSAKGKGAWYDTPRLGVRAQIQHLKGYATTTPPVNEIVDTRYEVLKSAGLLGKRDTWKALSGSWAYPGYSTDKYSNLTEALNDNGDYGSIIIKEYLKMREIQVAKNEQKVAEESKNVPDDWARESWEKMSELKLLDGTRPRDAITRQEVAIIMKRLYDAGAIDVEKLHK